MGRAGVIDPQEIRLQGGWEESWNSDKISYIKKQLPDSYIKLKRMEKTNKLEKRCRGGNCSSKLSCRGKKGIYDANKITNGKNEEKVIR